MSWRLGLAEDWRSLRHIHAVLSSRIRAWVWLFLTLLLLYCSYWHSFGPPLPKSPSIRYSQAECLFSLHACSDHRFFKIWLLHAFCNSTPRALEVVALHKIEKDHKSHCTVPYIHSIARRQQVLYKNIGRISKLVIFIYGR
jgi:hypothetical protein